MPGCYDDNVIRFQYPENWQVERQETEEGWTVSVQSPDTAFILINGYSERPEVQDVLKSALSAMQQDYPELEFEPVSERIATHPSRGYDINFFSLDTINSCQIRCFRTVSMTVLLLSQSSSFDNATSVAVLQAIRTSLIA